MVETQLICHHYAHANKSSLRRMPSNVRKENETKLHNCFAKLLSDVCHDDEIESHLQPLRGEIFALKSTTTYDDDAARLDIKANVLCESRFNKTLRCKNFRC